MYYILLLLLIGINTSPFVFYKLDIWHAAGFWVQICIALMFSWSFFEKPKYQLQKNIPLGLIHAWVAGWIAVVCFASQAQGKYDTVHFFMYFNFLCLIILYKLINEYINRKQIEVILICMKYVVIFTMITCVLQKFGLSQFFTLINNHQGENSIVTGFIGNGTHLSGFLGCCSPLFFWKMKRIDVLSLILMLLVLLYTGTTIGDPSISGYAIILALFFYFFKNNTTVITVGIILLICCLFTISIPETFFHPQGRMPIWKAYWPIMKQYSIVGIGPGTINMIYGKIVPVKVINGLTYPTARHIHLEYYQFAIELGLIGLVLILNMVWSFIKTQAQDRLQLVLKATVLGFCLSCLFNFPAHLWLPSTYAMISYAGYYALRRESNGRI